MTEVKYYSNWLLDAGILTKIGVLYERLRWTTNAANPRYNGYNARRERGTLNGSRDISSIRYDNGGHPSLVTFGNLSTVSYRRDGLGNLLETVYSERSGGTASVPTFRLGEHREYTSGGHVIVNGRLVMSRFGGGYFDGTGNPHYYVTDWQGNNIGVVDRNGLLEQRTRSGGLNEYRFPARDYVPGFPRFTTIDPMCEGIPWLLKI